MNRISMNDRGLSVSLSPNSDVSGSACSDYVKESKLKKILKKTIEDPEVIEKLKGRSGFGKTNYMVSRKIREMVDFKIQKLTRQQVDKYIKKIEENYPIFKCLFEMKREGNRW